MSLMPEQAARRKLSLFSASSLELVSSPGLDLTDFAQEQAFWTLVLHPVVSGTEIGILFRPAVPTCFFQLSNEVIGVRTL